MNTWHSAPLRTPTVYVSVMKQKLTWIYVSLCCLDIKYHHFQFIWTFKNTFSVFNIFVFCFYILLWLYFIIHILYIWCFSFYISFIFSVMMHLVLQCEMQCDDIIVTTDIMHNHPCCCWCAVWRGGVSSLSCTMCDWLFVPCCVSVTCMWVKKTENRTKVIDKIKSWFLCFISIIKYLKSLFLFY